MTKDQCDVCLNSQTVELVLYLVIFFFLSCSHLYFSKFFLYCSSLCLPHLRFLVTVICITSELCTNSETQTATTATASESVFSSHFTFMIVHIKCWEIPSSIPWLSPVSSEGVCIYVCMFVYRQCKHMALIYILVRFYTCRTTGLGWAPPMCAVLPHISHQLRKCPRFPYRTVSRRLFLSYASLFSNDPS